jgi:hypothetical protein
MKRCSYCGAEYPDEATVCILDQTPFEESRDVEAPPVASKVRRKIPKLLSIVSCYFLASGIFQIGWCLMLGRYIGNIPLLNIAYGILIIFVSRGLRQSSRRWYICAIIVVGLIICGICLEIVKGLAHSVPMRFTILYLKDFGVWLCIILALTRPVIKHFFYNDHEIAT